MTTQDGVVLRAVRWEPPGGPRRGTVLLLQGRAEFIEKYYEVVAELLARGFAIVAFDWRGQGQSGRLVRRGGSGHVGSFAEFGRDLDAIARDILSDCKGPVIALAHSMGGCIALAAASEGRLPADRLVATAPMLGLSMVRRNGLVRRLARVLGGLGFRERMVPGGTMRSISTMPFEGNRLSLDPGRYGRNAAMAEALREAAIGAPTIGWLDAAYRAMEALAGAAGRLAVPTLLVAAGDDPVCSTEAIRLFAEPLGPAALVTIPGSRHEILMERDEVRAAFWTAFDAFTGGASAGEPGEDGLVQAGVA